MVIPDKFNETDPNSKSERLISFLDIAPTILDLAGISVPEYMDGISFHLMKIDTSLRRGIDWIIKRGK